MPNHVQNVISLEGKPEAIRQMLERIKNDEYGIGTVDFNKIILMPKNIYTGALGRKEMAVYGKNNWYDWSIRNWNTKWNAYGYDRDTDYSKSEQLLFFTAWTAPHPVMEKLSELFPEIEFVHEWADEDLGMNCGRRAYYGGERTEEYTPESEKESIEFACSVWGGTPEDMGYVFDSQSGRYEYAGIEESSEQCAT